MKTILICLDALHQENYLNTLQSEIGTFYFKEIKGEEKKFGEVFCLCSFYLTYVVYS